MTTKSDDIKILGNAIEELFRLRALLEDRGAIARKLRDEEKAVWDVLHKEYQNMWLERVDNLIKYLTAP